MDESLIGREFRHFKGGRYRLEGFAKDSETLEEMVVYRALYGEGGLWVRPAKMFFEIIERGGRTMKRFSQVIEVVGAIIKDGGKYLVGQRPEGKTQGGLWEFMGGKIERGETPEAALARECREELALEIQNERIVDAVVHEYPEKTVHLTLISCEPKPGSTPKALEHQAIRWVTPEEMRAMPFCPADAELIERLF